MKHTCHKNPASEWPHNEDPCQCTCDPCLEFKRMASLPEIDEEELATVEGWMQSVTPGPWRSTQLKGHGPTNFIVSDSPGNRTNWFSVIARDENSGGFVGGQFIAWCRDGVPRLLRKIRELEAEIERLQDVDVIDLDRNDPFI